MPALKLMTFNVENLLSRYNFRKYEEEGLISLMDIESEEERQQLIRTHWNQLNHEIRTFTALTIKEAAPEVVCLQEVESLGTLKFFHDRYLRRTWGQGFNDYKHQVLIEANDPRGIDVAVMSRFKIVAAASNQEREGAVLYPGGVKHERIFRRDCLEVNVKKQNKVLTVFVCHFKSMAGGRKETKGRRAAEAAAVREIIEKRFADPAGAYWVVVGDLNDYTETDGAPDDGHGLGALIDGAFCEDAVKRVPDPLERWTHYYSGDDSYHQLDYILLSPALAADNQDALPVIVRSGQPFRAGRYQGLRWPRVGFDKPKASDHCPVMLEINF
jgi:endonuclease/exonuclease/phosphatase family metal-dependent hydrolase